MQAEV